MRLEGVLLLVLALAGACGCAATASGPATASRHATATASRGERGVKKSKRVIRGRLDAPRAARGARAKSTFGEAIVYVEKTAAGSPTKGAAARTPPVAPKGKSKGKGKGQQASAMVTKDNRFVPRVLAVPAGTTVEFLNADRVFHNTFSLSAAKKFDLGKYGPGQRRSVTFERPGVVNLFCELHPTTAGFVVVLPSPAFVHADASGAFALPPLPPGAYVVKAWHPRFGERRCRVELTALADADVRIGF